MQLSHDQTIGEKQAFCNYMRNLHISISEQVEEYFKAENCTQHITHLLSEQTFEASVSAIYSNRGFYRALQVCVQ